MSSGTGIVQLTKESKFVSIRFLKWNRSYYYLYDSITLDRALGYSIYIPVRISPFFLQSF